MKTTLTSHISSTSNWLSLLTVSVQEVFDTMLGTKVLPVGEAARDIRLEWTAMVGLAGQLHGIVTFSCDERSARQIGSKMLSVTLQPSDDRAYDAIGEICNMIAGNFKHKISELRDDCMLSPPTVVVGTDYRLYRGTAGSLTTFRATFTFDGFPVHVCLDVRK